MSDQVKIESITLKLQQRSITLSVEDARALQAALDELLGKGIAPITVPIVVERPEPWRYRPWWEYTTTDQGITATWCAG